MVELYYFKSLQLIKIAIIIFHLQLSINAEYLVPDSGVSTKSSMVYDYLI